MPQAPGCLFDILKEVKLECFHDNFFHHGVTKCEALAGLSMQDYPKYGVITMEDRVRLFKLVQIVKSVQAEGIYCRHQPSQTLLEHVERTNASTERMGHVANNNTVPEPPSNFLSNSSNNKDNSQLKQQDLSRKSNSTVHISQTSLSNQMRPSGSAGAVMVNVAVADSRTKGKPGLVHRKKKGVNMQVNPQTGSPMFKCRKTLTYSDSDDDQSSQEGSGRSTSTVVQVSNTVTQTVERQISQSKSPAQTLMETLEHVEGHQHGHGKPQQSSVSSQNCDDDSVFLPNQTDNSKNTEMGSSYRKKSASLTDTGEQSWHLKYSPGHSNAGLENNPQPTKVLTMHSVNNPSLQVGELNETMLLLSEDPSQVPTESVSVPSHATLKQQHGQSKSCLTSNPGFPSIPSPLRPKAPTVCSFFVEHETQEKHAYFPPCRTKSPTEAPKPAFIERTVHTNRDYNYGVPASPSQGQGPACSVYVAKGNTGGNLEKKIRVCVRKRPLTKREQKRHEVDVIRVPGSETVIIEEAKVSIDLTRYIHEHMFMFDEVFDDKCNNESLYRRTAQPLVRHVLNRGCATCFAFGQTGAGKTYTLLGNSSVPGLYQLAGKDIFRHIESGSQAGERRVWASYYEIYCSQLYDLLNKRKRLNVRENGRQQVCIAGLTETLVDSADQLVKVVSYGNASRSVGSTGVNSASSRSHAILQLEVRDTKDRRLGRMSFIDLAGSERASDVTDFDRQTRIEGAEINQSLLALKECIRAIDQESKHTPYRQSKLTHILRDSLLGNARTCMIANISPSQSACENTLNTLHYADRVKELRQSSQVQASQTPVKAPSNEENQDMAADVGRPKLRKAFAPTLFHPSNIQLASTPKATPTKSPPKGENSATNNVDLTKALQEAYESPIRGHKIRKTSERKKSRDGQSRSRRSSGGSDTRSSSLLSGPSDKLDRSSRDGSTDNERGLTPRSKSSKTASPAVTKERLNIEVVREPSADRFRNHHVESTRQMHETERIQGVVETHTNLLGKNPGVRPDGSSGLYNPGSHGFNGVSSVTSSHKKNKSDFIAEHRQILTHLDHILDRAKAAVDSNKSFASDSAGSASSPYHSSSDTNTNPDQRKVDKIHHSHQRQVLSSTSSPSLLTHSLGSTQGSSRNTRSAPSMKSQIVSGEKPESQAVRKLFCDEDESFSKVELGKARSSSIDRVSVPVEESENGLSSPSQAGSLNSAVHGKIVTTNQVIKPQMQSQAKASIIQTLPRSVSEPSSVHSTYNAQQDVVLSDLSDCIERRAPHDFQRSNSSLDHETTLPEYRHGDTQTRIFNPTSGGSGSTDRVATPVPGVELDVIEAHRQVSSMTDIDPEQFLRSLAEMRLARKHLDEQLDGKDSQTDSESLSRPSFQLNPELSKLMGNAKLVNQQGPFQTGSYGQSFRPFQALLGSPSNARKGSPFQPYGEQKPNANPGAPETVFRPSDRSQNFVRPGVSQLAHTHSSTHLHSEQPRRAMGDGASESCESATASGGSETNSLEPQKLSNSSREKQTSNEQSDADMSTEKDLSQSSHTDSGFLTQPGSSSGSSARQMKRTDSIVEEVSHASTAEDISNLHTQVECVSSKTLPDNTHNTKVKSPNSTHEKQLVTSSSSARLPESFETNSKPAKDGFQRQSSLEKTTIIKSNSPIRTEKLGVGTTFVPIHPFPSVTDNSLGSTPSIITKSVLNHNKLTKEETDELRLQLQRAVERHDTSGVQEGSIAGSEEYTPLGSPRRQDLTGTPHSTNSSMASSGKESAIQRAQCLLVGAHEEQLAETTSLCKQEMMVLMKIKNGDASFEEYLDVLHGLLSSKAQSVATLRSQIEEFAAYPDSSNLS